MISSEKDMNFEYPLQSGVFYEYYANHKHKACNWLVSSKAENKFCKACKLNNTIPNLDKKKNLEQWRKIERAKHRLIYSLQRFDLSLSIENGSETLSLSFDFLAPQKVKGKIKPVMTGHLNGLITINIKEANVVHWESMKEHYHNVLGHFLHKVEHFYWEVLIDGNQKNQASFTALLGYATRDYVKALKRYSKNRSPKKWRKKIM